LQLLDEIQNHLSDLHASSLGFICHRSQEAPTEKKETLETHTSIMYIGQDKNIKVKFYPENKSKDNLSTPDHLPSLTDNNVTQEEQNSTVIELDENSEHEGEVEEVQETSNALASSNSNSNTQRKFPVISEVIHIKSY
jgi:hypothetical protein